MPVSPWVVVAWCVGVFMGFWSGWRYGGRMVSLIKWEADRWHESMKAWQKRYEEEHQHTKAIRNELIDLHKRITAMTIRDCEVLEWVGRQAETKVRGEKDKSQGSSTKPSSPSGSMT